MSTEAIREVLASGKCPVCNSGIGTDDMMTSYYCQENPSHFDLRVVFHGGEKMTATLNGQPVNQSELEKIDW